MQITVTRSGGFAGIDQELGSMDTEQSDLPQARRVQEAVEAAGFFRLPEDLADDGEGADQFRCTVTVVDGNRRHTVSYTEGASRSDAVQAVRRIVDAVTQT